MRSPAWETGSADEYAPPRNPHDYAAFVGALAQHFGTKVSAYEIWNEEDAPIWWTGAPDPAAYTQLLQATYPVVKAADPSATVVLGGLTGNDYEFLEDLYKDGAKGSFDVVAVHTDTACNKLSPYEFLRGGDNRLITDSFLASLGISECTTLVRTGGSTIRRTRRWITEALGLGPGANAGDGGLTSWR